MRGAVTEETADSQSNIMPIERVRESGGKIDGLMPRCFITGAKCSHCRKIIHDKAQRHKRKEVMVFIIMRYSPITDAIYEWLIKDMIRRHDIRFRFVESQCPGCGEEAKAAAGECAEENWGEKFGRNNVSKRIRLQSDDPEDAKYLTLVRADDCSTISHVICESVCEMIQEADLVFADLTYASPNVFYELGMAAALNKKIVPICYETDYYEKIKPPIREGEEREQTAVGCEPEEVRKNIRNFPWKEFLFKFLAVNSTERDMVKQYPADDVEFNNYPYQEELPAGTSTSIGKRLQEMLNASLRNIDNLLLYDLSGFLTGDMRRCQEAYTEEVVNKICVSMKQPGDRVCLMYSDEKLEVIDMDRRDTVVEYSFGNICKLAVNQGIYEIEKGVESGETDQGELQRETLEDRFMKNYVYNRTELVSMDYPVYVLDLRGRALKDLDFLCTAQEPVSNFTYMDVVLANAANSNTAFMDFRDNSPQAFFWLGVFHGSGRFTVPLQFEKHSEDDTKRPRLVIDVAGLWKARYVGDNPEGFKKDIRLVLNDIYEKRGHLKYWQKQKLLDHLGETESTGSDMDYEVFYQKKFWLAMLDLGDIEIYPTPLEPDSANYISNWEYNGFSYINDYVNRLDHIHKLVFQDTLRIKRKAEEQKGRQDENAGTIRRSRIAFGDRTLNPNSRDMMKPYGEWLFMLRKCDDCRRWNHEAEYTKCPDMVFKNITGLCTNGNVNYELTKDSKKNYRGFSYGSKKYWDLFLTKEYPAQTRTERVPQTAGAGYKNETVTIYGHLVIIREIWKKDKLSGENFSVILEGASGPATYALAKILSYNGEKGVEKKTSFLFLEIQKMMLRHYRAELERKLNPSVFPVSDEGFITALITYMVSNLCTSFLPVITFDFLEAMKKRAWSFIYEANRQPGISVTDPGVYYERVCAWVEWIGRHTYIEALIRVVTDSSYCIEQSKDLRELDVITLVPDAVCMLDESDKGEKSRVVLGKSRK